MKTYINFATAQLQATDSEPLLGFEPLTDYVGYVCDDALSGRALAEVPSNQLDSILLNCRLVGWQCGFEPMIIAVHSYLPGVSIDSDEAEDLATDYLDEISWFSDPNGNNQPDFII